MARDMGNREFGRARQQAELLHPSSTPENRIPHSNGINSDYNVQPAVAFHELTSLLPVLVYYPQ
jgi:hypothetical protein